MSATLAQSYADRTLADIAATLPGATAVFRRGKLDFCCGGRVALARAAADKGLDLGALESELGKLETLSLAAEHPEETNDLIDFLIARYHDVHRRELPELIRLARRVEAVHRDNPAVPAGMADLLATILSEIEQHQQKEEQILFPMMRQGGHPMIVHPIQVMLAEHDDHGQNLRRLEALTHDFTVPEDACPTWRALYTGAAKFADDLMNHIHTENNVLFPRFTG